MAQKLATQHGACLALVAFWKNSVVSYHENGKNKYRKAAHMKIAASLGGSWGENHDRKHL